MGCTPLTLTSITRRMHIKCSCKGEDSTGCEAYYNNTGMDDDFIMWHSHPLDHKGPLSKVVPHLHNTPVQDKARHQENAKLNKKVYTRVRVMRTQPSLRLDP